LKQAYRRPAFQEPGIRIVKKHTAFGNVPVEVPVFDTPITPRENFKRVAARQDPLWVPNNLSEFQTIMSQDVVFSSPDRPVIHTNFRDPRNQTEDYTFSDWFHTDWTWVASVGGAMLTPGTCLVKDITKWADVIQWPNLSDQDFASKADYYMKNEYDPARVMHYDIGRGCTERFISVVGGYSEGMLAFALEPEAVIDFLNHYADFEIALFDKIHALYPLDMVTYHDDWGTERNTFFSEAMFQEIVFPPTKKIIDHIRSKGVALELHSCGNITRFMPYILELKPDFLQLQRRAVDIPALKEQYGDLVGFNTGIEGLVPGETYDGEKLAEAVQRTVELYAAGGGFYSSVSGYSPEQTWIILAELYAYSREFYHNSV
jgi:hypothetical protein